MTYSWQLWDNFTAAGKELDLELRSIDGGCVYMEVPEHIRQRFYVMCWTPLNKLAVIQRKQERKQERRQSIGTHEIRNLLDDLRQNHGNFHLEFGAKQCQDGSMYWFPELHNGNTPTRQQIVDAVEIMMDTENFEKHRLVALLREAAE